MQAGPQARFSSLFPRTALVLALASTSAWTTTAHAMPAPDKPVTHSWNIDSNFSKPAKPTKGVRPVTPVKIARATLEKLASKSDADVQSALDTLRLAGPGAVAAAPAVAALLDRGAHVDLTVLALNTLGELGPSDTAAAVIPYTGHRDLGIRRAAVTALGKLRAHGEHALAALRRALGDADDQVRAAAAGALAQPDAAPLAGDLVRAMDHKVGHSGLALGAACTGDSCIELAARFDSLPADLEINAGLDRVVERTDLSDELKMRVLEKIGSTDSTHRQAARQYLASLRDPTRWPAHASPALAKARDAALTEASGVR